MESHRRARAVPTAAGRLRITVRSAPHLVDGLEVDPEVLVEQGAVKSPHDCVGLRPVGLGGEMLDVLELQVQLAA